MFLEKLIKCQILTLFFKVHIVNHWNQNFLIFHLICHKIFIKKVWKIDVFDETFSRFFIV